MRALAVIALACAACVSEPAKPDASALGLRAGVGPSLGDAIGPSIDAGVVEASAPTYYLFATADAAFAVAIRVNEAGGYPRAGIDVGGGIHAPAAQTKTTGYADVLKHPTLAQWSYPADPFVKSVVGPTAVSLGAIDAGPLDPTWAPDTGAVPTIVGNH